MASILIAEDRAVDRLFLATLLGYQGHGILEASDGAEALALVQSNRPQLVISDVLMPTMDGYEFVRQMRAIPAVAATPVIFYTATYHEREARALAERCGVLDIITKPSEPEVILAKVDAVLGRSRPGAGIAAPDAAQFHENHIQLVNQKLSEKVRSLAETEHRLSALIDIGHRFAQERDPRGVLQQVCTSARELTLAKHGALALLSDDGTRVEAVVTSGVDPSRPAVFSDGIPSADLLSQLLERRGPVRRRDMNGAPDASAAARAPEGASYLGVPIATASGVYGWLSLTHKLGADDFTETDERMAVALAGQAALAYENARHVTRLEQEVGERTRIQGRMNFALAAARMGIAETALDTGRVVWSDSTAALFGISPDAFTGTAEAFYELVHPEDRAALREEFAKALRDGVRDLVTEFRTIWPDGSTHWLQTRARIAYGPKDRPLSVIDVSLDITDRKLLEAQFRQAQKMEAVGQLAGGIAHDFNNLLTAILGYCELLTDQIGPDKPVGRDVREIAGAAQRAAALTRQLLAFSRKQVLTVAPLDLNHVVHGIETMLRRLIGEHITITTILADDLHAVMADATQLDQVLLNLAVNARDAMPQGGELTIRTWNAEPGTGGDGPDGGLWVSLSVTDTGTGISEEIRTKIFEPFFTTKERGHGTGLGLAAVHGIITQLQGAITVQSTVGHGTTFRVDLPATRVAAVHAGPVSSETAQPGLETVLLVEDEHGVRTFIERALTRFGYQVVTADSAESALALVARADPAIDLLLTDVVLPQMSGRDLAHHLRQGRAGLGVLFMSGYTEEMTTAGGLLEAGVQLLEKPFSANALLARVRHVLDSRRAGDAL